MKTKIAPSSWVESTDSKGKKTVHFQVFGFAKAGTEVEMTEKDHKYITETFKRFSKSQEMLKKAYEGK